MAETIKVWTHDPQAAEAALLAGEETEDVLTQYGANEFAVDFLRESGLWEELLVKPKRGKENGKDWEKHVDKIKNLMETIILDRGYWSYDFLEKIIVGQYHIDYVVIAKKSFTFIKEDLRYLIDKRKLDFQERALFNRSTKEWETVKVAFARDICCGHFISKKDPYRGKVNVVVMKKMEGKEEKEIFYVTNKKIKKNPLKIVQLYGSRWTVENQGIRDLSQRWLIRIPAGRTLNAIIARICLILKLYNAMKIMEMKHGQEWQENKEAIEAMGERSFIGGQAIIVYTEEYFAAFTTRRYKDLIKEKEKRVFFGEIEKLSKYLPRDKIDELRRKLSG